jgi:Flp pilus assembly protein TadD
MKRLLYAAGLGLALLAVPAQAQTGTARGKVLDEQGQPLDGAKIDIDYQGGVSRHIETKTNKKGEYIQVGLAPGVYKFTASKEGFQSGFVEMKVSLGDATQMPDMKLRTMDAARKAAGGGADTSALQASFKAAAELLQANKLDEAEAAFKELQGKNPTISAISYNLGIIGMRKKDWPAAEAAYLRTIELKPDYVEAYSRLAEVYTAMGQPEKAAEVMQSAKESFGNDPKVMFDQAVLMFNTGKQAEAKELFTKLETADPANPEVQFYLGTIAVGEGKTDECIARLTKYVAAGPKNPQNLQTAQGLLAALKKK